MPSPYTPFLSKVPAMRMSSFLFVSLGMLMGCASSSGTPGTGGSGGGGGGGDQNGGLQAPGQGEVVDATAKSPFGDPYPTANIGYDARRGNNPGNVIKNYSFLGYVSGVKEAGGELKRISLADFFDPNRQKTKLLHIVVAARWCQPCNDEAELVTAQKPQLDELGVVYLQVLSEGATQRVGSTQDDLNRWLTRHKSEFPNVIDPNNANLGRFFRADAVPWNANIDPRNMEILSSQTGGIDPMADAQKWLNWIETHPATKF